MPLKPFVTLNTNAQMPTLGLGTWPTAHPLPGEMQEAIRFALSHGYKLIDTAPAYGNEKEVGWGFVLVSEDKEGQGAVSYVNRRTDIEPKPISETVRSEQHVHRLGHGAISDMLANYVGTVRPRARAQARPTETNLAQQPAAARNPASVIQTPIRRDGFFLIAKLDNADHKDVMESLRVSLQKLRTSYVDLWLMHWPAPMTKEGKADKAHDWLDTWKAMENLYLANPRHIKAIGVANFSLEYLERLLANCRVVPAVNKIELHPACNQQRLVDFCTEKGIAVVGYWPLGSEDQRLLKHSVVLRIAEAHNTSAENILISFQANKPNVAVLVKSVNTSTIEANSKLIELSDSEMEELFGISSSLHFRVRSSEWTGWGDLGFRDGTRGNVISATEPAVKGSQQGSDVTGGSPTPIPMEGVINET